MPTISTLRLPRSQCFLFSECTGEWSFFVLSGTISMENNPSKQKVPTTSKTTSAQKRSFKWKESGIGNHGLTKALGKFSKNQHKQCSNGIITKSVPVNSERTTQLYESNVPLPLAAPISIHLQRTRPGMYGSHWLGSIYLHEVGWYWCCALTSWIYMNNWIYTWTCMDMLWLTCSCVFRYTY